jgi:predicted Fe-Mo cluster-binding NifX family protein
MKIAIPVTADNGLQSEISEHFGPAPGFIIYNDEDSSLDYVEHYGSRTEHTHTPPIDKLIDKGIDAIVVSGIGRRAIGRLNEQGVSIYQSIGRTVNDVVEALTKNELRKLSEADGCRGHRH